MGSCALTQDFNLDCRDSIGGLKTVYFIEFDNVTSIAPNGESVGSPEVTVTTTGSTSSVALSWTAVSGAVSYKIYRGSTAGNESVYFTSSTNSFTDIGGVSSAGTVPVAGTGSIVAPTGPAAAGSATGGTLAAGTYYYKITAVGAAAGVITGITKATGAKFRKYNLVKQTGMFEETIMANEDNGTLHFNQIVKIHLNKLQASVRNEIFLLAKNRLIIVVVDGNGTAWLYGQSNAMLMNNGSKMASGTKLGDRNGYDLDFIGYEPTPAQQVDAPTLAALQTPGP